MKYPTCYLCNSSSCTQRFGYVRDNKNLQVIECKDCGLVFLSSFNHITSAHYERSGMHGEDLPEVKVWLTESAPDDDRRFDFLKTKIIGRTLLDFGCGPGGFLLKARNFAADVKGLEPELRLKKHFNAMDLEVMESMEKVLASGSTFDLITAFHVIEHLPDPRSVISKLGEFLKPGGELIIETPNSDDALLSLYKSEPFMEFTYWSQHLFLFNQTTLANLVRQAGLKILWLKQIQRYPLSNHLHWLAHGKPGGHQQWSFIDSPILQESYSSQLAVLGKCDTLILGAAPNDYRS